MMDKNQIIIFTDGSSSGNPGPGGWGAIVLIDEAVTELGGREEQTTNNRMELTAVIEALQLINGKPGTVIIHTDSRYVIQGITEWVKGWIARGWITSTKEPVSNRDLWEKLYTLVCERERFGTITWQYVAGHAGVPGNERVDSIATTFTHNKKPELYHGKRTDYSINLSDILAREIQKNKKDSSRSHSQKKAYSYVSSVGGVVMTHATWAECEARVKGAKGARFKKSISADDEKNIIKEFQSLK